MKIAEFDQISEKQVAINTILITLPLFIGLTISWTAQLQVPESIIVPTIGGGLMNFGFWLFHKKSVGAMPKINRFGIGDKKDSFLLITILHLIAIVFLLVFDIETILNFLQPVHLI